MRIKMLSTHYGSPDGHVVPFYPKGSELALPQSLAAHFISKGWAKSLESFDFNEWLDGFIIEIRKQEAL